MASDTVTITLRSIAQLLPHLTVCECVCTCVVCGLGGGLCALGSPTQRYIRRGATISRMTDAFWNAYRRAVEFQ